jgi:hypothetical protein
MSSTSTNKQPLMIDRPLLAIASVGETACLATASNLNTPAVAGLQELVNPGADGACIDSITAIATEASLTSARIIVFASRITNVALLNSSNCYVIGSAALGSTTVGEITNIPLLPLLAPVPSLASPAATMEEYPGELDKKTTGLLVPTDWRLYVGSSVALLSGVGPARVMVIAQGGYY